MLFYVCVFCMHICMCSTDVLGVHGDHKKALDLLELELRMVVNHLVDAGGQICVLCKSNNTLNP